MRYGAAFTSLQPFANLELWQEASLFFHCCIHQRSKVLWTSRSLVMLLERPCNWLSDGLVEVNVQQEFAFQEAILLALIAQEHVYIEAARAIGWEDLSDIRRQTRETHGDWNNDVATNHSYSLLQFLDCVVGRGSQVAHRYLKTA